MQEHGKQWYDLYKTKEERRNNPPCVEWELQIYSLIYTYLLFVNVSNSNVTSRRDRNKKSAERIIGSNAKVSCVGNLYDE